MTSPEPFRDPEKAFDELGLRALLGWRASNQREPDGSWAPIVDVIRRREDIVVRVELPGLKKEDVSVEVGEGVLTIEDERRKPRAPSIALYRPPPPLCSFCGTAVPLPEGVDTAHATATFTDGVLEVVMKGPEPPQEGKRRLEVH